MDSGRTPFHTPHMLLGGNVPVAGDQPAAPEVAAPAIGIAARAAAATGVRIDLVDVATGLSQGGWYRLAPGEPA